MCRRRSATTGSSMAAASAKASIPGCARSSAAARRRPTRPRGRSRRRWPPADSRSMAPGRAMGLLQRSYRHGERVALNGAVLRLRVDGRARRVSLRIDATAGEVVATAPSPRRLADAVAFAGERGAWIAERLADLPRPAPFAPGVVIEVLGAPVQLISAPGRPRWRAASEGHPAALIAPGEGAAFARAVTAALKREAQARLLERTAVHAAALG